LTPRIGAGLALSVGLGLVIAWAGLGLSYFTNYSPGFYVSTIAIVLYAGARLMRGRLAARSRRGGPDTPGAFAAAAGH
jgi:ABC-type Mn2+/Zn2+ transport system permease subunit